jgi:hypothetical protein
MRISLIEDTRELQCRARNLVAFAVRLRATLSRYNIGRVASDLTDIIRKRPREMADFLRAAKGLTVEDMARLARQAQKAREK